MKHENCENCLVYDELMEGILAPCDEEEAWKLHYCLSYEKGIPKEVWSGKDACPHRIEPESSGGNDTVTK